MQQSDKSTSKKIISIAIKSVIVVFAFWYIHDKIITNNDLSDIRSYFNVTMKLKEQQWPFWLALLLVPVNWGVETVKWRYIIRKIEKLSFIKSFVAVLAGVTISVFTPNRIGEYAGRVMYIQKADRIQAALITVIGSLAQLVVTLLVGALAFIFFMVRYQKMDGFPMATYLSLQFYVVMAIIVIAIFINTHLLTILLTRVKWLHDRFQKYIDVFSFYSHKELSGLLLISLLRFAVFSAQYFLILQFYNVDISLVEATLFIPVYLLTLTFVPTIALAELGVREAISIALFTIISANTLGIVSAVFTIWLINLALPALLGSIFVLRARLFK